ncbi:MAG: hypothetical protein ACJ72N_24660 [Labedaea sp.]
MDIPPAATPIVCDMTTATDTEDERIGEYRRLFGEALIGRERTPEGIRYRFRATSGVEARVRNLAAREKACCAFLGYDVSRAGDEVVWDLAVPDDDLARAILDEFYALPDTLIETFDDLRERFTQRGLEIISTGNVHRVRTS